MYLIETSYKCTIGFVLAAAVQTVEKVLHSPKLWPNIRSHLRTPKGRDAPTSTPLLDITYIRGRKRRLKNYLAGTLVGLVFTLIGTYRDVCAATKAVYCRRRHTSRHGSQKTKES